jgi:hypothetical protein
MPKYYPSGSLIIKLLESHIIKKNFRASKPKDLDRIAKRGCGHLLLKEENLSFDNDYIMFLLQVNVKGIGSPGFQNLQYF